MESFFELDEVSRLKPAQQQALIGYLRKELEVLKLQVAILQEVADRAGLCVEVNETHAMAAQLEAKIAELEVRFPVRANA
jgi:hypothetical protein